MQHRALLGDVDRLAGEHPIAQRLDAGLARELEERLHRILRDQVLRKVDGKVGSDVEEERFGAPRVPREEIAQVFPRRIDRERLERRPARGCLRVIPRAKAAFERLVVAAAPNAPWQPVEQAHVAAAEHDVFRGHCGAQQLDAFEHDVLPRVFAERDEAALAEQIFERLALVWKVRELEPDDAPVVDQRGPEPGSQADEEHAAAFIAAERLHRRIVHDADRLAESRGPVESDPALAKIPRLFHDRAAEHGTGNADGDDVVVPVGGARLDAGDDLLRRKPVTRIEFARVGTARMHQLDVGSAYVNDKDSHEITNKE